MHTVCILLKCFRPFIRCCGRKFAKNVCLPFAENLALKYNSPFSRRGKKKRIYRVEDNFPSTQGRLFSFVFFIRGTHNPLLVIRIV